MDRVASRERRHMERLRKKRRRQRITLTILFIAVLVATGSIMAMAFFSTDVYQDEAEFREYADDQTKNIKSFEVKDVVQTSYDYGTPISYAAFYDTCENKQVEEFRNEKISAIKSQFREKKTAEEAKRAKEQKKKKRYRPLEHALIIESAVYKSDRGVTSLAIYESDNSEKDREMVNTASNIYTYQFSETTGMSLIPLQIFNNGYKEMCSEYFSRYFSKKYTDDDLVDGWEKNVSAADQNFNKYVVTEKGVTFFFDEGTVLDRSYGVVSAGITSAELGTALRETVSERYIDPEKPMVALTYDDGPGGESEKRILECLRKNGAVATFFYLGNRVGQNPDNVKKAYEIGCELGNHTWSHPVLTDLKKAKVKRQIQSTNEAVKDACGAYPTLFRPSYGETNTKINKISKMPVIMWSVDTLDWEKRNGKKVFKYVSKLPDLDGKIILMHSIYDSTADATDKIVPWLRKKGYQMVTVSELFRYKYDTELQKGEIYP